MSKVKLAFAANEWKDGDGAEAREHHTQLQDLHFLHSQVNPAWTVEAV